MTSGTRMARNAGLMMLAQLLTWAMAFLVAIFQPRILGPLAVGQLAIAFSIWLIVGVVISFGMDTHLTKEIARNPQRTSSLVGTSLILRVIIWLVSCFAVWGYEQLSFGADPVQSALIWTISLATLFAALSSAIMAALVGLEQMPFVSLMTVLNKIVLTVLSLALLFAGFNVIWISFASIMAALVGFIGGAFILFRQYPLRLRFDFPTARDMLFASRKYLITALTVMFYQQISYLFIAWLASTDAVGWYSTATKLYGTLMFFPVAIGTVVFPSLIRSHAAGQDHLSYAARRIFNLMLTMSLPVGLGLTTFADPIVRLLYGDAFVQTGTVLAVLGIVLTFTYLNTIIGQLMLAAERTYALNLIMIVAAFATMPLNFILVTWSDTTLANGALGGALALMITEASILLAMIYQLPKGTLGADNLRVCGLSLFAALVMVLAIWWLRSTSFFFLGVPLGAIIYLVAILRLRVLPPEDLELAKEVFTKIRARLQGAKS
ncbi:polysaccharide biosynthesis protein [Candidatus Viridilinea mediisalina]|uniref:Polysaccharide biosynthesis protein n=2 Tax=Candidatus Viridilinea mediisalina TaxID=2024553 RepID=A0A2A6REF2_9CHLR|nr:polysaccharide biosynthesis protein [Candidatus Viridilinea mediisalina]